VTLWCALQPEGSRLESTSSHCVANLDKLLTHNILWGRQRETTCTSLISSQGGVKTNKPAFGQRIIIIIINNNIIVVVVIVVVVIIIIIINSSTSSPWSSFLNVSIYGAFFAFSESLFHARVLRQRRSRQTL